MGDDRRSGDGVGDGALPDPASPAPSPDETGGNPVCWLERVCDRCGALSDGPSGPRCDRCGAPLR